MFGGFGGSSFISSVRIGGAGSTPTGHSTGRTSPMGNTTANTPGNTPSFSSNIAQGDSFKKSKSPLPDQEEGCGIIIRHLPATATAPLGSIYITRNNRFKVITYFDKQA